MNEEAVPDLYRLAFMPGCFRCPQCGFALTKACINPNAEIVGTREQDRESEPCPNDGTMMVHVTYREQLEVYADRLKEEFDNRDNQDEQIASLTRQLAESDCQAKEAIVYLRRKVGNIPAVDSIFRAAVDAAELIRSLEVQLEALGAHRPEDAVEIEPKEAIK